MRLGNFSAGWANQYKLSCSNDTATLFYHLKQTGLNGGQSRMKRTAPTTDQQPHMIGGTTPCVFPSAPCPSCSLSAASVFEKARLPESWDGPPFWDLCPASHNKGHGKPGAMTSEEVCSCIHLKCACAGILPGCTKPCRMRGGNKETCPFHPK